MTKPTRRRRATPDEAAPAVDDDRRSRSVRELDELVRVVVERRAELDALRRERDLARSRAASLRRRPVARVALGVAGRGRLLLAAVDAASVARRAAGAVRTIPLADRILPVPAGRHRLRASAARERRVRDAAARSTLPRVPRPDGSAVLVVVRASGGGRAGAVAPPSGAGSPAAALPGARVVVIAPESGPAEVLRAEADVGPDVVVFLHDDVEPISPRAVERLLATLDEHPELDAVGGQLILGRREGPSLGPLNEPADFTLAGLGVAFDTHDGRPIPRPIDRGGEPRLRFTAGGDPVREVPVASSACLAVRRAALDPARGFLDADEDLTVALDVRAGGGRVAVDERAVFLHDERSEGGDAASSAGKAAAGAIPAPWAHRLHRSVMLDRLGAGRRWSNGPFHVGITVTVDDAAAGFGDWYTAHELGDALGGLGWRVSYLERREDRWYAPPADLDAIVVLLDLYDLTRLPPGVLRIAWIRNWPDHWVEREWFDDYDLVLTTSAAAKELVEARTAAAAHVFPLATNAERFGRGTADPELATDVAFVGSSFGIERAVSGGLAALAGRGVTVGVWGKGWRDVPAMAPLDRGPLDYDRVPDAYRSTRLVVDDANEGSTRDLGLLNSRVFDALAAGALVVTNNVVGARELMDDDFPTWSEPDDLAETVGSLLADPTRADALLERYRAIVLERHTYEHRARELRDLVEAWCRAERWAIAIGPRTREAGRSWGDTYFGHAVQRQLARAGRPTTVLVHDEWAAAEGRADVALHVFGARAPGPTPGVVNLLWVISHPERIDRDACDGYDAVLVASDSFAADLATRVDVPVVPLHQATDPDRFRPTPGGPVHELLFIGSSRGQRRPMVDSAVASGHDVAVYGGGWDAELLEGRHLRGEWVPNEELAAWYGGAAIVLADHYDDMRELGFISNRIYDALASGAFVLSDAVAGLDEEFDGGAIGCASEGEAIEAIERFLAHPAERHARTERGRAAVIERHTFRHRVDALLELAGPLLATRPATIEARPDAADEDRATAEPVPAGIAGPSEAADG